MACSYTFSGSERQGSPSACAGRCLQGAGQGLRNAGRSLQRAGRSLQGARAGLAERGAEVGKQDLVRNERGAEVGKQDLVWNERRRRWGSRNLCRTTTGFYTFSISVHSFSSRLKNMHIGNPKVEIGSNRSMSLWKIQWFPPLKHKPKSKKCKKCKNDILATSMTKKTVAVRSGFRLLDAKTRNPLKSLKINREGVSESHRGRQVVIFYIFQYFQLFRSRWKITVAVRSGFHVFIIFTTKRAQSDL